MVSCIAFWFRLTRNEHLFTSGLLVGHGHTNTTSQNNATVSASHAIRIHVCVPSRDGTACCGFDNVRRVDCVHLGYMISTFNASRRSNNIQQPQQSDASTWPTCEWLLPSCQCRKACSPRRSARGPHNMQRGGAKVPSWSTILWLKNVNDSKYAGFYRIVLLYPLSGQTQLQRPSRVKSTELLWLGLGMWFFSANSYNKLLRWRAEHKSFFQRHTNKLTHAWMNQG